jgi:hypothetical protein
MAHPSAFFAEGWDSTTLNMLPFDSASLFVRREQQVPFGKLRAGSHRAFSPVRNDKPFLFSAGFGTTYLQNARGERPAVNDSLLLPSWHPQIG